MRRACLFVRALRAVSAARRARRLGLRNAAALTAWARPVCYIPIKLKKTACKWLVFVANQPNMNIRNMYSLRGVHLVRAVSTPMSAEGEADFAEGEKGEEKVEVARPTVDTEKWNSYPCSPPLYDWRSPDATPNNPSP